MMQQLGKPQAARSLETIPNQVLISVSLEWPPQATLILVRCPFLFWTAHRPALLLPSSGNAQSSPTLDAYEGSFLGRAPHQSITGCEPALDDICHIGILRQWSPRCIRETPLP